MNLTRGINLDVSPRVQPEGSWRGARNLIAGDQPAALTTELGTSIIRGAAPTGSPVGYVEADRNRLIWFTDDGEVGILSPTGYLPVLKDSRLNLSTANPVSGRWFVSGNGNHYVAFWDGKNPGRLLNLTDPGIVLLTDLSVADPTQLELLQLILPAGIPTIELLDTFGGGALTAGAYALILSYEDANGNQTAWLPPDVPVVIGGGVAQSDYRLMDGREGGVITGRQITYRLSRLDTRYKWLRCGIVLRENGVVTAYEFRRIRLIQPTITLSHTGAETQTTLSTTEVLVPPAAYLSNRTGAFLDNQLLLSNLKTRPALNYQTYANNIKVSYITADIDVKSATSSFRNPLVVYTKHGFAHSEVYALYICFRFRDGQRSEAYHIPGRPAARINETWNTGNLIETDLLSPPAPPPPVTVYQVRIQQDDLSVRPPTTSYTDRFGILKTGTYPDPSSTYTAVRAVAGGWLRRTGTLSYAQLFNPPPNDLSNELFYDATVTPLTNQQLVIPSGGQPGYLSEDAGLGADVRYYQTRDTTDNPAAASNLGYWENTNELYPDGPDSDVYDATGQVGTLRNTPVRHHRMPTLRSHYSRNANAYPNQDGGGQVLGFILDNVFIPDALVDQVVGYELCYARRDVANSLVLGQSLAVFGSSEDKTGENQTFDAIAAEPIHTASGNWHFYDNEDSQADIARWLRGDWIRMHPPDMLRVKAGVLPTYVQYEVKLGRTAKIKENAPPDSPVTDNRSVLVALDYLDGADTTGVDLPAVDQVLHRLTDVQYLGGNTNPVGSVNNAGGEECIVARLTTGTPSNLQGLYGSGVPYLEATTATTGLFYPTHPHGGTPDYGGIWVEHYLATLMVYREDIYVAYGEQSLIPTGTVIRVISGGLQPTSPALFGGDTILADYGVRLTSPVRNTSTNPADGVKTLLYYAVEATMNIGFRHEGGGYSYYPRIAATGNYIKEWLDQPAYVSLPLAYNADYTAKNDLQPAYPYTEGQFQEAFPNRILRFRPTTREGRTLGLRLGANDYYDLTAERGEILHLHELGDRLLIHCRQGPYLTVPRGTINVGDGLQATLGTGGIFDVKPQAIGSSKGELGLSSLYSAITTPLGYFFFSSQGTAWIIDPNGNPRDLTGGLYNWFEQQAQPEEDNPYQGDGLLAAWDARNRRILLQRRNAVGADWCWSWSPLLQGTDGQPGAWVSQRDNLPKVLAASGREVYDWQNNHFYREGGGNPAVFYDTRYPVTIDVAFPSKESVKWFALSWVAEVLRYDRVLWNRTFTRLLVYTLTRCSGYVELIPGRGEGEGTTRYVEGRWWSNAFRDQIIEPLLPAMLGEEPRQEPNLANIRQRFRPGDFVGDHVIIRLEFLPKDRIDDGLTVTLHSLSVEARISIR